MYFGYTSNYSNNTVRGTLIQGSFVSRTPFFASNMPSGVTTCPFRFRGLMIQTYEVRIIVDLLQHVLHGVVLGEDLDAEIRWIGKDLALFLRSLYYGDVRNSETLGANLDSHGGKDLDA